MSKTADRDEILGDYFQLGEPTDGYIPGDNQQKIDLDEHFKKTDQDGATVMVMGAEELNLGVLSKRTAALLKLPNLGSYDPYPSARNARMGAEGFFTSVKENFQAFIENIIKYIRMAIDWVVDTIKAIFGFRKSERITKAIDDNLDAMKSEFEKTLVGLGMPVANYDVSEFIGNLPKGHDRGFQLKLLKTKFEDDKTAIEGLTAALPLFEQAAVRIKQTNDKVLKAQRAFKKAITDEYNRTRVRSATTGPVPDNQSTEVNRVILACQEMMHCLDVPAITEVISKLYSSLYKVEFTNDELSEGFNSLRAKLKQNIENEKVQLTPQNTSTLLFSIQYLNKRYQEMNDSEIDLSKVDWRALGNTVDKSDSDKIRAISQFYNAPKVLSAYQETSVAVRKYSQFCFGVTQELLVVKKQISNLVEWHHRCHAYYYAGVIGDVESIIKAVEEARKAGHSPMADLNNLPTGMVYIKEADAQTLAEKAAANVNFIITEDVAGVKTAINNFGKQIGWGTVV